MNTSIKIAFHLPTQKFIHIDNASNGLSCKCECLECKEKLEAIQGELRTKHFRHNKNTNCEGSQESALHELGKQILLDNSQIAIPYKGTITYSDVFPEEQLETKRPDVTATFDGKPIYFEIYVSHAVDKDKEKKFIDGKHKSVEIDLSNHLTSTFDVIRNAVLITIENKRVIYWTDETQSKTPQNYDNWVCAGLIGLILLGLHNFFTNKKPKYTPITAPQLRKRKMLFLKKKSPGRLSSFKMD